MKVHQAPVRMAPASGSRGASTTCDGPLQKQLSRPANKWVVRKCRGEKGECANGWYCLRARPLSAGRCAIITVFLIAATISNAPTG